MPDTNNVVHLESTRCGRASSVADRINSRLRLLRQWLEGVPKGQAIPKNLSAAAHWNQPELGILPIHSPNDFTRTHAVYGKAISEIAEIISLLKLHNPSFGKAGKIIPVHGQSERDLLKDQVTKLASQWHAERDARLQNARSLGRAKIDMKRQADALNVQTNELTNERALVSTLRKQLSEKARPFLVRK